MSKTVTVVTATIASINNSESYSLVVGEESDLSEAIEEAKTGATERFNDEGNDWEGARMFHSVVTFPEPKMTSTQFEATLPELPELSEPAAARIE